ncbi:MAG: DUF932 domain-containing protein [Lachnospiraceae bacterium]|nr:DUF932 domain-containing protein [Lachnospiraceae bacterium]
MREATWQQIGTDVSKATTVDTVLKEAGLDYDVELRPVFMEGGIKVPNAQVAVRTMDNHPYGIVSDKYSIVQNRDAFDFVNYLTDEVEFEKAGETASGMVWIIAKLPEKQILGDAFTPHVIFRNSFAGKFTIAAAICPLRHICSNQFNFAFKHTANTVNIRHIGGMERKLADARLTLKASYEYMEEVEVMAERYSTTKMSQRQVEIVIDSMFPVGEDAGVRKENNMERLKEKFIEAYNAEDNRNFKGSAWGLINAYTDYSTHVVKSRMKDRRIRAEKWFVRTTMLKPMDKIVDVIDATV